VVLLIGLAVLAAVLKPWQRWAPGPGRGTTTAREARRPVVPVDLRREDIPPRLLALAGGGDPAQAPRELAAVLGDGRYLLPRVGRPSWMDQGPDGKVLAVPLDEDVVLFQAPTGTHLQTLKGPGGRVVWVTFSRDSQLLAATTWHEGSGGAVRVWDLRADRELYTNPQPEAKASGAAAFSPDGRRLVTGGGERLQVWEARSGQEVQAVELRSGGVPSLCFRPDGRRLAVVLWHGQGVRVFDWDGEKLGAAQTLANRLAVGTVVYSPDGKVLARGDTSGFKLWNAETLEELRTVATPALQLAFAPDSRTLFAAWTTEQPKAAHTFTRWDVVTGEELPSLSVEVSADRDYVHHYLGRDGKLLFVVPGGKATHVRGTAPPSTRWPSVPTAGRWPRRVKTERSSSGTWPPAGSATRSAPTPTRCSGWRSAPTATGSPRGAATARSSSGTRTAAPSCAGSRATRAPSRASASAPTAGQWRPAVRTAS
jgi:hypothetical protein